MTVLSGAGPAAAARAGDLPPSAQDPAEAREVADEILSRSEYGDSLLERLDDELAELVERVLDSVGLSVGGGTASWLGWLALAALVGGVAAFLAWSVATGRFRRGGPSGDDRADVVLSAGEGRTAADWAAAAEEHEAAGRWRQGLLCRYRSLVVDLCDRGVIPDVAGRTAGEYVADVAAGPYPVDDFAAATTLFEEVWYGGAAGDRATADRFAELAGQVRAGVPRGRRRPADATVADEARSTPGVAAR